MRFHHFFFEVMIMKLDGETMSIFLSSPREFYLWRTREGRDKVRKQDDKSKLR